MKNKLRSFLAVAVLANLPLLARAQYLPDRGNDQALLPESDISDIIMTVLLWLLLIFTYVAVIGFVVSGIMYITAGGSGRAEDAKKWMTSSIIGVVVGLSGYIIIRFVTQMLEGP